MKLPNNYGSVIKLSGKRRKPYAVRTSSIQKQTDGTYKQVFKYLAYFEKADLAYTFLAEYNNGKVVKEHKKYATSPTFAEMYRKWEKWRKSLKSNPVASTWHNYDIAFNHLEPIHNRQIVSIRANEVQDVLNAYNHKSKATITNMRVILKAVWAYAINEGFTDNDIPSRLVYEWTNPEEEMHKPYTPEEIAVLWEKLYEINNVDILLIMIYTGMRPSEMLNILTVNVHLDEQYMIGGMKTAAGRDRVIPIADKILPLIKARYDPHKKYLINNKFGNHYDYKNYANSNHITVMGKLKMKHKPHDCRHTFATLMNNAGANDVCTKLIMGHSFGNDITKGVYTHKSVTELLAEVNKI